MTTISVRRPVGYLCAAAALAAGALLVPGAQPATAAAPPPPSASAAPAAEPGCTQVQDSLRPDGPLPAPGAMPAGSTMAAIAARGRVLIGVDQSKYLMSYRNPLTGEFVGSDIDIARLVATAIFGDPNRVQYIALTIADRIPALERGQVDLVVDSFAVTCERQRKIAFSSAYLPAAQRLLVPRGSGVHEIEDLAGRRVCTSTGSTNEATLRSLGLPLQIVTLPGISDCMVGLQRGTIDAVTADTILLAGLAAQDPETEVVGRTLLRSTYAVGMRLDAPDLVRFVNAVLERGRTDGTLAASDKRWYGGTVDPAPQPPPAAYRD